MIDGVIDGMCIFPEYEAIRKIDDPKPNNISKEYMPNISVFEYTPCFAYKSWAFKHEVDINLVAVRVVLIPPIARKELAIRLIAERVFPAAEYHSTPKLLERITLAAINSIEVR